MNQLSRDEKMVREFPFFIWATLGYALFYVICLYKNPSGITFPLFTLGTIIFFVLCMKKLDVKVKPYSIFYVVCIELFGLSTCLTDSGVIIFLNKCSIFFLVIVFLLHNFYDSKDWNFLEHIKAYFIIVFVSIGFIYKPFMHLSLYRKIKALSETKKENHKFLYVFLGVAISLPLVVIVLALLISADAVFENIFVSMFEDISLFSLVWNGILIGILFVIVFFVVYMLVSFLCNYPVNAVRKEKDGAEPLIAITISVILSFIYVMFCGIQVVYLFVGGNGLTLPNNMTYAEYAREGFFQLLYVCIINLIFVLIGIYFFKKSNVLKVFLSIITGCTYIMIASSAMRMLLYIQYKYLTFLRVFVLWALLVIALIMIGVFITIFKKKFDFFHYAVVLVSCLYLLFSFAHVDYLIAKVNLDNASLETQYAFFEGTELYDDISYLTYNLSYDAAPAILEYEQDDLYIEWILEDTDDLGIRNFNVSRFIALQKVKK